MGFKGESKLPFSFLNVMVLKQNPKRPLDEGKNVKLIPETPNVGKMYDFLVDGVPTELKTFNGNNINTLVTKVGDALKQINGEGQIIYDISKAGFTPEQMTEINARLVGKYGEQIFRIITFVK